MTRRRNPTRFELGSAQRWVTTAIALSLSLSAASVSAEVTVDVQLSATRAEIGQRIQLQATALGDDGEQISNPTLPVSPGLVVTGPTLSTQSQISISGGGMVRRSGITATWGIAGNRIGDFVLGPITFDVDGTRVSRATPSLQIVARGTLPSAPSQGRRRGMFGFDPFEDDPFDMFPPGSLSGPGLRGLFGQTDDFNNLPPYPAELGLDHAADSTAFLRAEVKPERAVIGQQITFSVYAYGSRGPFAESASSEASRPDFFTLPIVDTAARQRAYRVAIGDQIFHAAKIREYALFPLHAGSLQIGSMRMGFLGRGYPETINGQGLLRHSPELTVSVSAPPTTGRPVDYQLGDVGDYRLQASVAPREVEQNQSVSVVATLSGTGNLPSRLAIPEQQGVEWLEPNLAGEVSIQKDGRVGGTRTFTYIVKLTQLGDVDLGELRLAHYSPTRKRYVVATARLGQVSVKPGAAAAGATAQGTALGDQAPPQEDSRLPLSARLSLRDIDLQAPPPRSYWADSGGFWWGLMAGPLGLVAVGVGTHTSRNLRRRWTSHRASHQAQLRSSLKAAEQASRAGQLGETARELERAVYLCLEARSGIRARALLRDNLRAELQRAQVPSASIQRLSQILDQIETLRFAPTQGSPESLVRAVKALCARWPALPTQAGAHG